MEGLRHSLLAPSGATVFILLGCVNSMMDMIKIRYAAKDDNGKDLYPHPYTPWKKVDPKYEATAEKVYRSFKTYENVKEWTFISLPVMWIFALYAGSVPHVSDVAVDLAVVASAAAYCVGNHMYMKGYVEEASKRVKGFKLRTLAVRFWLFGSGGVLLWATLQRFGIVG